MPNGQPEHAENSWLMFALMTVVCWGVYGVFLAKGQMLIGGATGDPNARYKAFLFVGIAYFLTAVLAPLGMLMARRADWNLPGPGMTWSLIAGIAGAAGAFCVLLAFGAQGKPPVVMSIVFAGAPIVNAFVVMALNPPPGGLSAIKPPFILGLILAALGGALVTRFAPAAPRHGPAPAPAKTAAAAPDAAPAPNYEAK